MLKCIVCQTGPCLCVFTVKRDVISEYFRLNRRHLQSARATLCLKQHEQRTELAYVCFVCKGRNGGNIIGTELLEDSSVWPPKTPFTSLLAQSGCCVFLGLIVHCLLRLALSVLPVTVYREISWSEIALITFVLCDLGWGKQGKYVSSSQLRRDLDGRAADVLLHPGGLLITGNQTDGL